MAVLCKIHNDRVEVGYSSTSSASAALSRNVLKSISIPDFIESLYSSTESTEQGGFTDVVYPRGLYFLSESLSCKKMMLYYPEKIVEVIHSHEGGHRFKIPMPNVVMSCKVEKESGDTWRRRSSILYGMTPDPLESMPLQFLNGFSGVERIKTLALPNMYSDSRLCAGQNSVISTFNDNNFRGFDWMYQVLYESPFNNDLPVPGLSGSLRNGDSWLNHLDGLDRFPYERFFSN